jgi:hypothetical protein
MRSAITVAGILGVAMSRRRISGSTASTIDPVLSRRYVGGSSERSAVRTVFLATPTWRAISLIDRPSDFDSRRISAQSSTFSTLFPPGSPASQGPRIHVTSGGPAEGVKVRTSIEGQYSAVADSRSRSQRDGLKRS